MKNRVEDIRRRHKERKRLKRRTNERNQRPTVFHPSSGPGDIDQPYAYKSHPKDDGKGEDHPLARKEWLAIRVMIAAILLLGVGILFKNPSPTFGQARAFIHKVFEVEFQFAAVADWYKRQFGEPLALLPQPKSDDGKDDRSEEPGYAEPVSGTVTETFADTGKGVMLETEENSKVHAVKQGMVLAIEDKGDIGTTVVVGLPDGGEAWYGKLSKVDVKLYDHIESGEEIGVVTPSEDGDSGMFYFALKQGDAFVNPAKVISFD